MRGARAAPDLSRPEIIVEYTSRGVLIMLMHGRVSTHASAVYSGHLPINGWSNLRGLPELVVTGLATTWRSGC